MWKQKFLTLLAALMLGIPLPAPATPAQWEVLRQKMTFAQFESLLIHVTKSSGVSIPAQPPGPNKWPFWSPDPHLMGGLVRGAVLWILEMSQSLSYEEILAYSSPAARRMLGAADSIDYDIVMVGSGIDLEAYEKMAPMKESTKEIDFFPEIFLEFQSQSGGSAFEKLVVGSKIIDPLGALRDLYSSGRFRFQLTEREPEIVFQELKHIPKVVRLLKHLRLMNHFGFHATPQELTEWSAFVRREITQGIPQGNGYLQKEIHKLARRESFRTTWFRDGKPLGQASKRAIEWDSLYPIGVPYSAFVLNKTGLAQALVSAGYDLESLPSNCASALTPAAIFL